jgi:hypothetical protein
MEIGSKTAGIQLANGGLCKIFANKPYIFPRYGNNLSFDTF